MFNPEILRKKEPYEAAEGCLSLTGLRRARRWRSVKVQDQNERFQTRIKTFTGEAAQVIQFAPKGEAFSFVKITSRFLYRQKPNKGKPAPRFFAPFQRNPGEIPVV